MYNNKEKNFVDDYVVFDLETTNVKYQVLLLR